MANAEGDPGGGINRGPGGLPSMPSDPGDGDQNDANNVPDVCFLCGKDDQTSSARLTRVTMMKVQWDVFGFVV